MNISTQEVDRMAKLARLSFSDSEKQKLQQELAAILDYVGQLRDIESKVPQVALDSDAVNLMRNDVAEQVIDPAEFFKQAPSLQDGFIKVKSILE